MRSERRRFTFGLAIILLTILAGASCRKPYEEEVELREMARLRTMLKGRGDTLLAHDSVLYARIVEGETVAPAEGSTLGVRFALYAVIQGKETILDSNIDSIIRRENLLNLPGKTDLLKHSVGADDLVEGLCIGLTHFFQLEGRGWLGIPSRLAYGAQPVGLVPPDCPLLCYVYFESYHPN